MRVRRRRTVVLAGVAATAVMVGVAAVTNVALAGDVIRPHVSRMSVGTTLNAETVWLRVTSPSYICSQVDGCTKAVRTSSGFKLKVNGWQVGSHSVTGWVSVRIVSQQFAKSLQVRGTLDSRWGSATEDLSIRITRLGGGSSRVVVRSSVAGTGLLRVLAAPVAQRSSDAVAGVISSTGSAQVLLHPQVGINLKRVRHKKVAVTSTLSVSSVGDPAARGKATVYVNGVKACTAKVTNSQASCVIARPAGKATITAAVEATLSNGFAIFQANSKGYRR